MPVGVRKNSGGGISSQRNSGIEILKIIGILSIISFHVTQTISSENIYIGYKGSPLDLSSATADIQILILSAFRYAGNFGNTIFFVSSAWFLIDSKAINAKKWFGMLVEVWAVSVIILILTLLLRSGDIAPRIVIQSLFPSLFANNWYVTCYLLFYPIHTVLNGAIDRMSRGQLFRSASALAVVYLILNFIKGDLFFTSRIIVWVSIYFVVAYVRRYMPDISSSRKATLIIFFLAAFGNLALFLFTDLLGLKIDALSDRLDHWAVDYNPLTVVSVIALLNLAGSVRFQSKLINSISKRSLLIYIIHENIILRRYYRPSLINYVFENYGHEHAILWVLILSVLIFVASFLAALLYEALFGRPTKRLSECVCKLCTRAWRRFESAALRIH